MWIVKTASREGKQIYGPFHSQTKAEIWASLFKENNEGAAVAYPLSDPGDEEANW